MQEQKAGRYHGILFMALFACASCYIGEWQALKALSISPLIIGIVLGMAYANSLRNHLPATWGPGIKFCSKSILRLGIILYGFRLTFQDVVAVGLPGIVIDCIIVAVTILGGVMVGKWLKMDSDIALLTSIGSGICGAAAVLGAEATIKTQPYKTAVAVATVVIFGTLSMFLYPIGYRAGIIDLTPDQMGIFSGATLHEVAHAVGAGNAMGDEIANVAIITKMIRVMLLVPVLLILGWWAAASARRRLKAASAGERAQNGDNDSADGTAKAGKGKVQVPWFAFGFLLVIGFNSLDLLPAPVVGWINDFDTFLLTMAMAALGAETSFDKFKQAGAKPFVLATILYVWLLFGGYLITKLLTPVLA